WFLEQLQPGTSTYIIPAAVRLLGQLHIAALEQSLNELVRRHESLRTTFVLMNDKPVQCVADSLSISLQEVDLRHLPGYEQEAEVLRLVAEEIHHPCDLTCAPLMRTS